MKLSSVSLTATLITITIGYGFLLVSGNTEGMETLMPFIIGLVILWGGAFVNTIIGLIVITQSEKGDQYIGALSAGLSIASIIIFLTLL